MRNAFNFQQRQILHITFCVTSNLKIQIPPQFVLQFNGSTDRCDHSCATGLTDSNAMKIVWDYSKVKMGSASLFFHPKHMQVICPAPVTKLNHECSLYGYYWYTCTEKLLLVTISSRVVSAKKINSQFKRGIVFQLKNFQGSAVCGNSNNISAKHMQISKILSKV